MTKRVPKEPPGNAENVATWNSKIAARWMKDVARLRPDDVLDSYHSEDKGKDRSISIADARDVILNGSVTGFDEPHDFKGNMSVTVTFQKRGRARTIRVVGAAHEGSPYVRLVSLQNVWE